MGGAPLRYEELSFVLAEAKATINSRPLTFVYNELEVHQPLTPAPFLNLESNFPLCHLSSFMLLVTHGDGNITSTLSMTENWNDQRTVLGNRSCATCTSDGKILKRPP